ncbi:MAG TPA: hypothetical protein VIK93_01020 [Limnochordales bacterium]
MAREASIQEKAFLARKAGIDAQQKIRLAVAGVVVLALVGGVLYFALGRPVQVLPRGQEVPAFNMTDHRGAMYAFPDRARPINVFVVAAAWDEPAAAAIIPLLEDIDALVAQGGWQDLVQVAWITPDPERDDVAAMAALAERLPLPKGLDVALLTAAPVTTRLVVGGGFGIYVGTAQGSPGGAAQASPASSGFPAAAAIEQWPPVTYEPALVLVDDLGYVRARYEVRRLSTSRLARDLGLLTKEMQADGASRLVYEAAHLFLCYPR